MTLLARTGVATISLALIAGFGTVTIATDAEAAWKPRKPVEFIIMAGKGGGADRLAMMINSTDKTQVVAARAVIRLAQSIFPHIILAPSPFIVSRATEMYAAS